MTMMMIITIYIYIYLSSVCVFVKKNHHFRAERQRREARRSLGLAGRRLWPSDDNDDIYIMMKCLSVTFLLILLS